QIAHELNLDEQTVRNYFGAKKFIDGKIVDQHIQPGPAGGIVELEDTSILTKAKELISRLVH
ncbi:MAG: DNA-binding protein, partial [Saprospiraceae bacterium]